MLVRIMVISTALSLCLLLVLLNVTNPTQMGPFGVLLVFGLLYIFVLGLLSFVIYFSSRLFRALFLLFGVKNLRPSVELKRTLYYSSVVSAGPVIIIGLNTVSSLGFYEFSLVILLMVLGCFYVAKTAK